MRNIIKRWWRQQTHYPHDWQPKPEKEQRPEVVRLGWWEWICRECEKRLLLRQGEKPRGYKNDE